MRKVEVKQNFFDKVVNYFNPVRAQKRFYARARMMIAGGYVGGSKSRRSMSEWVTTSGDADSDIFPDLETIRDRSRDLSRNAPIAVGAINTKVTNVIGTGLKLQSRIDSKFIGLTDDQATEWESNTEREFKLWAETKECDIERTLTYYEIQELVYRSVLVSGDVFVLLPMIKRASVPYSTKIQLVEADRVSNPNNNSDTDTFSGGIERDQHGAPIKYHIIKGHPGNKVSKNMEWQAIDAFGKKTGRRNVLHLYQKLRPGQTRGIPDLAPVIEMLKQLSQYVETEMMASVVSAMFTVFVKTENDLGLQSMEPTAETGAKSSDKDFKLSSGAILDLAPGESIESANPGRPNISFDPFILAILRQVGVALELPFEILIKHFTASYSAARAATLEASRFYTGRRRWITSNFCMPTYEAWLTEAVSIGRINAPGFLNDAAIRAAYLSADWIGPPRGQIDPVKENKADEISEDRGWKTAAQNTAERGNDFETNHRQRVKESKMKKEITVINEPTIEDEQPEEDNDKADQNETT